MSSRLAVFPEPFVKLPPSPPFVPKIRYSVESSLSRRAFASLILWLSKRKWKAENIQRIGFDLIPILGPTEHGMDSLRHRMLMEAARVRDWIVFTSIPPFTSSQKGLYLYETLNELAKKWVEKPDEMILRMFIRHAREYPIDEVGHQVYYLLEQGVKRNHLPMAQKLLKAFPEITLKAKRDLLHYPFDQSIGAKTPESKESYRKMMELLDPEWEIPRWLRD